MQTLILTITIAGATFIETAPGLDPDTCARLAQRFIEIHLEDGQPGIPLAVCTPEGEAS